MLAVAAITAVVAATNTYDVVVYGANAGGVLAAVAAAQHGAKTALLCQAWPDCFEEGGKRIGGMTTGPLTPHHCPSVRPLSVEGSCEWRCLDERCAALPVNFLFCTFLTRLCTGFSLSVLSIVVVCPRAPRRSWDDGQLPPERRVSRGPVST
jgi:glycine/D-amino acid oxidase-like deaminating enzyme